MEPISFDKLLLKTAFCCMASDGKIDKKEIAQIKLMYEESQLFKNLNFQDEINLLINKLNSRGIDFIKYYFELVETATLTEQEELILIDFAIQTIHSDGIDDYSEIKFFKNIRHRLKVSDEEILKEHPEVEYWLESDIITDSYLEKIANQYLESAELPQFELISMNESANESSNEK
jgi:uncharacterized tellurite resistance protein B-like protein